MCGRWLSLKPQQRENAARTGRLCRPKVRGQGTPPGAPKLHSPPGAVRRKDALGNIREGKRDSFGGTPGPARGAAGAGTPVPVQ
jgi:hypothetical protein